MKKILIGVASLGAIATPTISVIACSTDNKLKPEDKDSVVMIVGQVGHNDKGFLEGAYNGVYEVIKANIGLKKYREIKIPSSSIPDAKKGTKSALLAGAYHIVGVGYQYPSFINGEDFAVKYPNRKFIGIDGLIKGIVKSNVLAVNFNAEQASFLTGVAGCLFLAKNYSTYSSNGGLQIGAFGGAPYEPVKDMLSGFIQGIAFYNDNLALNNDYKVKFIGWGTAQGVGFTGGFVAGAQSVITSKQLINKNADIIFPVAGGQVSSVVDAIKAIKNSNIKIIGVDSDQSVVFGKMDGSKFITSSMKDTSLAVSEALKASYGKLSKLQFGQNNNVGVNGNFVKIARGLIASDNFGGSHFQSILKSGQNYIDTTSDAKTIYEQLIDSNNLIFKVAKSTKKSNVNWNKISMVWKKVVSYVVKISDM